MRAKRGSNTLAHRESNVLLNSGFPKRQTKPIGSVSQKERLELNVPPEEEKNTQVQSAQSPERTGQTKQKLSNKTNHSNLLKIGRSKKTRTL